MVYTTHNNGDTMDVGLPNRYNNELSDAECDYGSCSPTSELHSWG